MKGMDIFCASQASTSICLSHQAMDLPSQPSSSSSAQPLQLGGRAIDRHNPIIRDPRRVSFQATITPTLSAPCSSSQVPPINPIPYHQLQKPKSTPVDPSVKSAPPALDRDKKPGSDSTKKNRKKKKKNRSSSSVDGKQSDYHPHRAPVNVKKNAQTLTDFITPPGSSRYLLGDPGPSDGIPDNDDPVLGLVPVPVPYQQQEKEDKSYVLAAASKHSSSSRFSKSSCDQVVVLRVSLHCKGCEGKLRKHLSRMEGVTSFNIDFPAKKVTVVGDVTPLSVLASVSKVKSAQFWTSAPSVVGALSSGQNKPQNEESGFGITVPRC